MALGKPDILYGKGGKIEYYSANRLTDIFLALNRFTDYKKRVYEKDSGNPNYAKIMLRHIESIKKLVPETIREFDLTPSLRVSNKELGELEKKCEAVLK